VLIHRAAAGIARDEEKGVRTSAWRAMVEERLAALTRTMDAEAIMVGWYGRVIVDSSWMLLDVLVLMLVLVWIGRYCT
jgi:hypothetical protein